MRISFSPVRRDDTLTVSKSGDVLTINGEAFDLSPLPDGGTLPHDAIACPLLAGDVERIDGEIALTLILPHGPNPPPEVAFPADLVDVADGNVELPT
jgi:hypothetical protein